MRGNKNSTTRLRIHKRVEINEKVLRKKAALSVSSQVKDRMEKIERYARYFEGNFDDVPPGRSTTDGFNYSRKISDGTNKISCLLTPSEVREIRLCQRV